MIILTELVGLTEHIDRPRREPPIPNDSINRLQQLCYYNKDELASASSFDVVSPDLLRNKASFFVLVCSQLACSVIDTDSTFFFFLLYSNEISLRISPSLIINLRSSFCSSRSRHQ